MHPSPLPFGDSTPPLTVSALTAVIKDLLETGLSKVKLEAEISNFRPSSTGHWYFTLKDEECTISAVMFRNRISSIRFNPTDGSKVLVHGSISVYGKRGTYQIVCESMEQAGEGRILQDLEERKRRLAAEGLFDPGHKRALPLFPRRVVVITSPTGAALRDILQVLGRRAAGLDVCIVPVPVQGDDAGPRIAEGIACADRLSLGDVLIVGRGGGSLEDLLPFSDEVVVRAIHRCSIPVISAVGHEIDTSLSDLAADLRAPTPSAAAELVAASREELQRRVLDLGHTVAGSWLSRLGQLRMRLKPYESSRLEESFRSMVQPLMQRLDDAKEDFLEGFATYLGRRRDQLKLLSALVESLSPWDILARGYAAVYHQGELVDQSTKARDPMTIRWHDGERQVRLDTGFEGS